NNLLYLIFGIFLGLLMASGVLSDLSLWSLSVDWNLPHGAYANEDVIVPFRLTNEKRWFPSVSTTVTVEAELGGAPCQFQTFVPIVSAGQTLNSHLGFQLSQRGWLELKRVRLYTRFPFGLLKKRWTLNRDGELDSQGLYVYPAPFQKASF